MIDFTQTSLGFLSFGGGSNVLFSFDLATPTRQCTFDNADNQSCAGLDANGIQFATDCPLSKDNLALVGHPPAPQDAADVVSVELEMTTHTQPGALRTYCFLYRDEAGTWHDSAETFHDDAFDAATGRRHATLTVDKGRITQLYVAPGYSSGAALTKLIYHVRQ